MRKNILIVGPARVGKTTLARRLNEKLNYSIINLDNIISVFENTYPELGIKHNGDDIKTSSNFAPFIIKYLKELADGPNFWNGNKFVIEGTHIDFEKVLTNLDGEKYMIIGLVYNYKSNEELYNDIKKYDTEDDWTYYCEEEELKGNINYFLEKNRFFYNKFKEYDILIYDVSNNRDQTLNKIIEDIKKEMEE